MTTDLEADLRREFDVASLPSGLTFSPDSVLCQGNRTIRRHRMVAAGSAAMAVALVAVGATLFARPDDKALPLPATHIATTGIAKAQAGFKWGQSQVQFDRDVRVRANVIFSVMAKDGRWHEVGRASTHKPGQKPDAIWKSGVMDGHPFTIGLIPGQNELPIVRLSDGDSYGTGGDFLKDTGYAMFYIDYAAAANVPEPAGPSEITSIRWTGPNGVIDGIEGNTRLSGRVLTLSTNLSVDVVLGSDQAGRSTVLGQTNGRDSGSSAGLPMSTATTDVAGVAVMTGRAPVVRKAKVGHIWSGGAPIAAGILPPGASHIEVILTTNQVASGLPLLERLPDGRVIFAVKAEGAQPPNPSKDSIKAVTWTYVDGTQGRQDVTQKRS